MKQKTNSGQALLTVLLSMAVVLIVVLSVLARSVTDISISSQDEDSLRAFSAAEAGVEKYLIIGAGIGSTAIGNASYSVDVSSVAEGQKEFNYPSVLFSGESATVWFAAHDEENNFLCSEEKPCFKGDRMKICWGKEGSDPTSSEVPAIELSVMYLSSSNNYSTAKIGRAAIDPNSLRREVNSFSEPDNSGVCTIDGENYQFQYTLEFQNLDIPEDVYLAQGGQLQYIIIRSIYNIENINSIGVSVDYPDNTVLPSQGNLITSAGISGNANRKIEVFKQFGRVPEIFDFSVFTFGSISK